MRYCQQMALYAARSVADENQREAIFDLACERVFSSNSELRPLAVGRAFDAIWSQSELDLRQEGMKKMLRRSLMQRQGGCNAWRKHMVRVA